MCYHAQDKSIRHYIATHGNKNENKQSHGLRAAERPPSYILVDLGPRRAVLTATLVVDMLTKSNYTLLFVHCNGGRQYALSFPHSANVIIPPHCLITRSWSPSCYIIMVLLLVLGDELEDKMPKRKAGRGAPRVQKIVNMPSVLREVRPHECAV